MFSIWRSLPVRVTQFSQAVAAHKSLLSSTFWCCIFSPSASSPSAIRGSPLVRCICMPAINNWAFHSCHLWMRGGTIKGWREPEGRRGEISRGEKGDCWRERGRFCSVSVGCAVCILISSTRKVWWGGGRGGGGGRGETLFSVIRKKNLGQHRRLVWIYVSVWGRVCNKCTHPLHFCKRKPAPPCWCLHWFSFPSGFN